MRRTGAAAGAESSNPVNKFEQFTFLLLLLLVSGSKGKVEDAIAASIIPNYSSPISRFQLKLHNFTVQRLGCIYIEQSFIKMNFRVKINCYFHNTKMASRLLLPLLWSASCFLLK